MDLQQARRKKELEDKHRLYQWQEGDEHYVKPVREDHFSKTTIPWTLGESSE